jgi:hypothetical protein
MAETGELEAFLTAELETWAKKLKYALCLGSWDTLANLVTRCELTYWHSAQGTKVSIRVTSGGSYSSDSFPGDLSGANKGESARDPHQLDERRFNQSTISLSRQSTYRSRLLTPRHTIAGSYRDSSPLSGA